jgi:23S rRNA pseudouridine2604 synthase
MATKKPTLTLAKRGTSTKTAAPAEGTGRNYSTRAKQAARRDGRELPGVRGKPKDPLIVAATGGAVTPDARKPREPREAPSGAKPRDGARRPAAQERGTRPAREGFSKRGDDTRRETNAGAKPAPAFAGRPPRGANADTAEKPRAFVPRPATRRSTGTTATAAEPIRKGRYDGKRDYAAKPAVEASAPAATPVREPDGMVRVSKLLSEQGLCSRREADSYIARGWVWADGVRVTELGTRVLPTAKITLDQHASMMQEQRVTILLNKPVGYVSGQAEDGYQPASVLITAENQIDSDTDRFQHINRRGLAPAGRLDIDSTGLLVLTQDGRIAKQLIGENSTVEKEYLVRVEGKLAPGDLERLRHGLELDGEALKPAKVKWQNADQLNFILREGKKRQIRRMCEMVGLKVIGLKRIRIGNVLLGDLPPGKWRFLRGNESFTTGD